MSVLLEQFWITVIVPIVVGLVTNLAYSAITRWWRERNSETNHQKRDELEIAKYLGLSIKLRSGRLIFQVCQQLSFMFSFGILIVFAFLNYGFGDAIRENPDSPYPGYIFTGFSALLMSTASFGFFSSFREIRDTCSFALDPNGHLNKAVERIRSRNPKARVDVLEGRIDLHHREHQRSIEEGFLSLESSNAKDSVGSK